MKWFWTVLIVAALAAGANAQICNIKVVTDANPDYTDMPSLIHSVASKWKTDPEKCWAMWYWNHIGRRQTQPMELHGMELTDPIRQFNDYGFTMCSTVAGVNCSIWHNMGYKVKFWDISNHTVPEVFYDGRYHMYDDSLSAIYTLCDGHTIAGVQDIGKTQGCAASGGREEPGHIAKYHCLCATSANGFVTGADTIRALDEEYRCFNPNGLKFRSYYNNWDWGHRYILNLREGESYTRTYGRGDLNSPNKVAQETQGEKYDADPAYFVPNHGRDPETENPRYHIRGNGVWTFSPKLTPEDYKKFITSENNIAAEAGPGLHPAQLGKPAEVVFKIEGANVITSMVIKAGFIRQSANETASISISTTNGLQWKEIWKTEKTVPEQFGIDPYVAGLLVRLENAADVNGSYEALVKVTMEAKQFVTNVSLNDIQFETRTEINSKTQPKLLLGRNTVYVDAGDQTDSIVYWPDLQADHYKPFVVEEKNIATSDAHMGYQGCMFLKQVGANYTGGEGYVVFRMDSPRDITRVVYGGRLYNRAPKSHIDLLHSFDGGKTWTTDYTLSSVDLPWDVIKYVTLDKVPQGTRSVLFKYLLSSTGAGTDACSIYAMRMEANHLPIAGGFKPLNVTFTWDEVQKDRTLRERSYTERVDKLPHKFVINTGGADTPVAKSLKVDRVGDAAPSGYEDGKDVGGEKYVYNWATYGKNFLEGKPYTVSAKPTGEWGGDDPKLKKLTDGVVGPNYAGGIAPGFGACFNDAHPVDIVVDIGEAKTLGAFRIHTCGGWPWWEAFKGEVADEMEVATSLDGKEFTPQGKFETNLRMKDLPINHVYPDDETSGGWNFELIAKAPVQARWVKFTVRPKRIVCITEVQALDFIKHEPFDIRIALPDEK